MKTMLKNVLILILTILLFIPQKVEAQNNEINVTASVDANASHVQLDLKALNTSQEVSQDTFVDYEVTYGSYSSVPLNLALEVEAKPGIIEGAQAPSVDLLDYVFGSPTTGFNSVPPIIDLNQKKIRWTFNFFPGNILNQKVRFAFRTNSVYQGTSKVNFSVVARIIGPNFVSPDKVVTKTYKYNSSPSSTSTTATSTPAPATSNTTSPATIFPPALSLIFRQIFLPVVTDSDAKIFIQTFRKFFQSIKYGKKPSQLNDRVTALNKSDKQEFDVTELTPDTTYYFKAEAKDDKGNVTGTETFTFKTAETSDKPEVEKSSLIVTSQSNFLAIAGQTQITEDGAPKRQNPSIVIPKETPYEIRFAVKKKAGVKKVQAIVRDRTVLGISTAYAQDPNTEVVDMVEVEDGIYVGSLKSKPKVGYYEQLVRIEDVKGNVSEEKIADIKVLNNFTVRASSTKEPLEGAKVLISLYNPKTKLYQIIPPNIIPIENPGYTDGLGEINLVLPQGKYKAEVSNLGYKDKTVEFVVGSGNDEGFPTVYLDKGAFSLLYFAKYLWRASGVFVKQVIILATQAKTITESTRVFNLIASFTIPLLILLGILSFRARTRMNIFSLMRFFLFHSKRFLPQNLSQKFFFGLVLDGSSPVPQATIFLLDNKEKKVIDQTQSNNLGEFYLKTISHPMAIMAIKKGYEPTELLGNSLKVAKETVIIRLKKREALKQSILRKMIRVLENILGLSFEFILVATTILEIFFAQSFGIVKTAPFFAISLVNFLIWLFYIRQKFHRKPALS